jgi:uncharacterized protein YlbG (UPF0298 family)
MGVSETGTKTENDNFSISGMNVYLSILKAKRRIKKAVQVSADSRKNRYKI